METDNKVHIIVSAECRENLKSIKIYPRETFGEVIERLVQEHEKKVSSDLQEKEIKLSPEEEKLRKSS